MITVLTALHDLIHLGQFSAQRQEKKEESEHKNWEGEGKKNKGQQDKQADKEEVRRVEGIKGGSQRKECTGEER